MRDWLLVDIVNLWGNEGLWGGVIYTYGPLVGDGGDDDTTIGDASLEVLAVVEENEGGDVVLRVLIVVVEIEGGDDGLEVLGVLVVVVEENEGGDGGLEILVVEEGDVCFEVLDLLLDKDISVLSNSAIISCEAVCGFFFFRHLTFVL